MNDTDPRRRLLLAGGLSTLLAGCGGDGEEPQDWPKCPEGTQMIKATLKEVIEYVEVSAGVSAGGGRVGSANGTIKIPVTRLVREVECAPPPPRPPRRPRRNSLDYISLPNLRGTLASSFQLIIQLPDLLQLTHSAPVMTLSWTAMNGSRFTENFMLASQSNAFRFANPGADDFWSLTAGRSFLQGDVSISPFPTIAYGQGIGDPSFTADFGPLQLMDTSEIAFGGRRSPIFDQELN